jgi:hypothetical protein
VRGFGFGFGLLARGTVLRMGCVSAFLFLGLELGGTGREDGTSPPRAGWYPSPVLGSPNLRLRLRSLTRGYVSRLRPGDVDVQAEKGNRGADGCRWDAGVGAVPRVGVQASVQGAFCMRKGGISVLA